MSHVIPFTAIVEALPADTPFVGPETIERCRGSEFILRLGANESSFGISPRAAAAIGEAIHRTAWYCDPEGYDLRSAISQRHDVDIENVCLGGGIDEILGLVVRMLVAPGTPVVTSRGAYPTFNYQVKGFAGALHMVPYRDDHIDLEALSNEVIRLNAPLVYFANPDNPMGTWHNGDEVQMFIESLPGNCIVILDEAYTEFAPASTAVEVDVSKAQVMRMRTFSKVYGMAGMRIGYTIANAALVTGINKIRNHFAVNRMAQAAALASLEDRQFLEYVVQSVDEGRQEYYRLARRLGLEAIPSATNFVAIDMGGDGDRARQMLTLLESRNVFVRMPGVAPLDRCIRVSVGTAAERAVFASIFEDALAVLN